VEAEVALNLASSESRSDLAVAYFRFGEMLEKKGDLPGALQHYKRAVAIEESMTGADPTNTVAQGDLSEDYMKVSDVSLKLGDRAKALEGYRKALSIREELVAKTPDNAEGRTQLARIYESLGDCFSLVAKNVKPTADRLEAKHWYQQSLDVWTDLQRRGTLTSDYVKKPNEVKQKITSKP
jgi:tetratricopeptide (TPR) repeat protein